MITLRSLLTEESSIKSMNASGLGPLYHGTAHGKEIGQTGLKISTSGFGQRGLKGLALTTDEKVAWLYAQSHAKYDSGAGNPEVLVVSVSGVPLADLRNTEDQLDIWNKLGYHPEKDEYDRRFVQLQNERAHGYAVTDILKAKGFGGAVIPNTLHKQSSFEVCIFDPKEVKVTARRLNHGDYKG